MRQRTRTARFALADCAAAGPPAGSIKFMGSEIIMAWVRDRQATPAGLGVPSETQNTPGLRQGALVSHVTLKISISVSSLSVLVRDGQEAKVDVKGAQIA